MKINSLSRRTIIGAATISVLSLVAIVACHDTADAPTTAVSSTSLLQSGQRLSPAQKEQLRSARAKMRWVGDAHHEAMKLVIAYIADSKRAKRELPARGSHFYCSVVEQAGLVALRELARQSGAVPQTDHRARVRSILATECPEQPSLSTPTPTSAVFRSASWMSPQEAEVTGQYETFVPFLEEAVLGSDGSVWNIRDRLDLALGAAVSGNVPEGDLLALASFAGLIESSAEEWNAFDWSLYQTSECDFGDQCTPASFPQSTAVTKKAFAVIGADAIGCLSTVKSWGALKVLLGTAVPAALAGECGVRATLASGGAIIAMLK